MKTVNVKKNGVVTNSAQFSSQEEATEWLNSHIEMGSFGEDYVVEILDVNEELESEKDAALLYLSSTDWMIIRELETGIQCPQDVKNKRQECRDLI